MIRKTVGAALVMGLFAAAAPAPARATNFCSTGSLQVCASITAFYGTGSGSGGNGYTAGHLFIHAWNLFGSQGISHVMTFVGIGNSSWTGTASFVAARFNGNQVNTWVRANSLPNGGTPNNNPVGSQLDLGGITNTGNSTAGLVGCGAGNPANQYQTSCGGPGGPFLELEFTTSSQIDLQNGLLYGMHSQDVNGGDCSLWVDSSGRTVGGTTGACSNVVPEPISMILLGTGLAGVGGMGAIRRRKKDDEIV